MKNNKIFTIVFFSFLAIVLVFFFYMNFKEKRFNWYESYKSESDQPYGTAFIMKMLKSYADAKFTYNTKKPVHDLLDSAGENQAYVFIGESIFLDSADTDALVTFIANGNDAFLATTYVPPAIISNVLIGECDNEVAYANQEAKTIQTNFYHPRFAASTPYSFTYKIKDREVSYFWDYLDPAVLCDSVNSLVPLGYIEPTHVNFLKIPYGKGNLYLHSNPILFTNFFMTKESNTAYASSVFSHLRRNHIVWDEYSKVPMYNWGNKLEQSPLYFIMEQQSLRYAWWLLLVTALLYVLFAAKRKQKIIPVLESRANTSLQFVSLIASLHYHNQNHTDMARKKMKHFLHYVRTKYNMSTHKIDDVFIKKLSLKSGVSEQEVENIFDHYKFVEKFKNITVSRLADLYRHIDNFYKHGK
jgi:hypothetical protein